MIQSGEKKCAAVILAAGDSTRMGRPKALLQIDGVSFLQSIILKLEKTGITDIIIVLGRDFKQIEARISIRRQHQVIINPYPEQGPLSSIQLALKELKPDTNGFLLILVDHPLVSQTTYQAILAQADSGKIIIPVYNRKSGHPVYFGRKFFNDLVHAPLNEGARHVVHKYPQKVKKIEVPDDGILHDIDLPGDYEQYIAGK